MAPLERNSIYAGMQAGLRPTPAAPLRLPGTATIDDVTAKGRREGRKTSGPLELHWIVQMPTIFAIDYERCQALG